MILFFAYMYLFLAKFFERFRFCNLLFLASFCPIFCQNFPCSFFSPPTLYIFSRLGGGGWGSNPQPLPLCMYVLLCSNNNLDCYRTLISSTFHRVPSRPKSFGYINHGHMRVGRAAPPAPAVCRRWVEGGLSEVRRFHF